MGTIARVVGLGQNVAVHPHGRGDNDGWSAAWSPYDGSPPRAWGQSERRRTPGARARFTPTGVGTIPCCLHQIAIVAVHPHGRGDNPMACRCGSRRAGSPPRAWGQYLRKRLATLGGRFTPTGVGTMRNKIPADAGGAVHPHGRGDNDRRHASPSPLFGSPPRAWGQCAAGNRQPSRSRFTPTGVGTMLLSLPARFRTGRFTPTGVGTMKSSTPSQFLTPVHPHGRGDNSSRRRSVGRFGGSPPRAWGQSRSRLGKGNSSRFTPTGVGTMSPKPDR